jgi:hypothetical protein
MIKGDKALNKALTSLNKEADRQCRIMYPAAVLALWNEFGWRHDRITKRLCICDKVAGECIEHGTEKSMLDMLEEETGIEMTIYGYDKSFHEIPYLSKDAWDGKPPTRQELLYIRTRQRKWLGPLILANLCLGLHRSDGFGPERIQRFIEAVDVYRMKFGNNVKEYAREMERVTGISGKMLFERKSWVEL